MGWGWDDLANIPTYGLYGAQKLARGKYGKDAPEGGSGYRPGLDYSQPITEDYQTLFGRAPTAQEIAVATPIYEDPNGGGRARGMAYLANLKTQQDNTPDKLYAKQQADNLAKAPQYYDAINKQFKDTLGRDATDAEKQHFGSLQASGQVDPYGIDQMLQQSQEYRNTQDTNFRNQLTGQLQGVNADYYQKHLLPDIQNQFAQQGRSFDSSGFQNAAIQAGQQQNYDLSNYLGQLSASQYGGNVDQARGDYQNYVGQLYGRQNAGINAAYGNSQQNIQRQNEIQDYNTQRAAYSDYLSRYGKRGNMASGALSGGASGAAVGFTAGGPYGALLGGVGGAALGAFSQSGGNL